MLRVSFPVVSLVLGLVAADTAPARGETSEADAAIVAMDEAIGLLERYEYQPANERFRALAARWPEWVAAQVNLGISALNLQEKSYLAEAERAFLRALELDPRCAHALVSLAILRRHDNRAEEAVPLLERAAVIDPQDAPVRYWLGATLADLGRNDEAKGHLEEALRLQPSFASALYRLGGVYARTSRDAEGRARRRELLERFQRLERAGVGVKAGVKYGEGGRYNTAIRGTAPPGAPPPKPHAATAPSFGAPVSLSGLPESGGGPPALAAGDVTGDGRLELVVAGAETVIVTAAAGTPRALARLPVQSSLVALGDLDGDRDLDLIAASADGLRIVRNLGAGRFASGSDVEKLAASGEPLGLVVVDADSDWDLDVIELRREGQASRLRLWNNDGDGTWTDITASCGLAELPFSPTAMVWADLDGDVDADLLLVDALGGAAAAWANDRVWTFRQVDGALPSARGVLSIASGDFDADGELDFALLRGESIDLWRGTRGIGFERDEDFARDHGGVGGTAAVVFDFRGALEETILVLDPRAGEAPRLIVPGAPESFAVELPGAKSGELARAAALVASIEAQSGPALLALDASRGLRSWPLDGGGPWLAIDLRGPGLEELRQKVVRSNSAGIGATVEIRAGARRRVVQLFGGAGAATREPSRLTTGLRGAAAADVVRILWPDGVLQSELALVAGELHRLEEVERKPTSCPVLFAWNGEAFEFVADFLGVGGLGYFEAPGQYHVPDPTELLAIPRLVPRHTATGPRYELRVLEPLEECTYLDAASLLVVDHPEDIEVLPLEMFAVAGPSPGYELLAFRERVPPRAARDHRGVDVLAALREIDHERAPAPRRDERFPGTLDGVHSVTLEWGDEIEGLLEAEARGGRGALWLLLFGHIEYGYSTSNFASWQAGFVPRAPTFSVERRGEWVPLREEWGFPGGYPRWMAVDLARLLEPGDRRLRIETNLDIGWDTAFLALAERLPAREGLHTALGATLETRELAPTRADLRFRGFPGDPNPFDGGEGFVYDAFRPWEHYRAMPGAFTRFGDVRELLGAVDDRFVVFGPGDEIVLEFPFEEPATGSARSALWKCFGFCKDMDPYTAHPEGVEPLPFRAMTSYPFGAGETPPDTVEGRRYRRTWNTREVRATTRTPFSELGLSLPGEEDARDPRPSAGSSPDDADPKHPR